MKEIKCPKCGEIFAIDENSYADILKQVRDDEFSHELDVRQKEFEEKEALRTENALKDLENEKNIEIAELRSKLNNAEMDKKAAIAEIKREKDEELYQKKEELAKAENMIEAEKRERKISESKMRESYKVQLDEKDKQIEQLRDMKARMSTKMVGESLEQHCEIQFNRMRAAAFPNAEFEKDNDIKGGSKGDFIFRDYDNDMEYISIMFEMKNEMESTVAKHKNEEFFKKLDKDRRDKNCEYAVLVSLLESDSEYYNDGIVDLSYKYEKMYVVRPQFFIPIITILRNAARESLSYRRSLIEASNKNVDITNFENDLNEFKVSFSRSVRLAGQNFDKAMDEIDSTIQHLEKVREDLRLTKKQLLQADNKVEDLTIKKLTKNNPTMQAKFAELDN